MASWWWLFGSVGVAAVTALVCSWRVAVDGYVRFFMEVAVARFLC